VTPGDISLVASPASTPGSMFASESHASTSANARDATAALASAILHPPPRFMALILSDAHEDGKDQLTKRFAQPTPSRHAFL
jgi:hypothetical protein